MRSKLKGCCSPPPNRSIQLDHTVDGPNGHLDRDLHRTLVSDDTIALRFGGVLNIGSLAFVRDDDTITIRLGRVLNVGSLAFVGNDDTVTVRLGGVLNVGGLTLLDGSLEDC